jgi:4a-hydroxytetrahydrobiopterin dehydratase
MHRATIRIRTPNGPSTIYYSRMDMLSGDQITQARLADWRKLAQGLHARYAVADFAAAARLVAAIATAVDTGDHLRATLGAGFVDLKLISQDAVYTDGEGTDHVVEWTTERDVELARRITDVAAEQGASPDVAGITSIELALDTAHHDLVAPFWSALLTGGQEAQGRGTIGDDVRDLAGRVPYLWFQQTDEHETPRQRFHWDVFVPHEYAEQRIAAALAAGGTVVSQENRFTILADPDGNKACVSLENPPAQPADG